MSATLILFEDERAARFDPLIWTRSVGRLRLGAWTQDQRFGHLFPERQTRLLVRPAVADVERGSGADVVAPEDAGEHDTLFVAAALGRPAPETIERLRSLEEGRALLSDGRLVAARGSGPRVSRLAAVLSERLGDSLLPSTSGADTDERMLAEVGLAAHDVSLEWSLTAADFVAANGEAIDADFEFYASMLPEPSAADHPGVFLLEPSRIRLADGVRLDPGVVLDARAGSILLGAGTEIRANSVITGPVVMSRDCLVKPLSRLDSGVSLGPVTRVGGEVHTSIVLGYSNKQHDGFLGNSYVGEWVNLGAATDTSDLRNDYGTVKLVLAGETVDTRRRSVGSLIGDHTKTAIHTRLNTGTVLGVSCNVFGSGVPPRAVPGFSWGGPGNWAEYRLDKATRVAATVTSRREIEFTESQRRLFAAIHEETTVERHRQLGIIPGEI
ncbi:MAG: putative sugar nucleotidyl transferase [bacterium]